MMGKIYSIALVVNDLDNYLQIPAMATLAGNVINVTTSAPVPNPDYATMKLPVKAVLPIKIPGSQPGQVVFLEWKGEDNYEVVSRLNWPSHQKIKEVWNLILSGPLDGDGMKMVAAGNNIPLGLGLINLNVPDFLPNLPPLVWLLVALFSGYGAYQQKKITHKIGLGLATWLAASKFIQAQQKNIKL